MPHTRQAQLNVRSAFAHGRVTELAKITGMTATQIVEDALRAYVPPGSPQVVGGLVREGRILVIASTGRTVTLEETNAALEAVRNREDED